MTETTAKPAVMADKQRGSLQEETVRHRIVSSLKMLTRNRLQLLGSLIVLLFLLLAILAPLFAPYDPVEQDLTNTLQPPSLEHPFGTDDLGRDILSRILYGTRISLVIIVSATALGMVVGVTAGLSSGYYRGMWDHIIMGVIDVLLTIPPIVLALAIVSVLQEGTPSVIIAVGVTSIPRFARLVRSVVLSIVEMDYITAARSLGSGNFRIISTHVLPNAVAPIIVQATLGAGAALLTAAALSFLGLGVQPPAPEWGAMLSRGRSYLSTAPHIIIFPGLAIAFLVLGLNLFGDGLRDTLDPRLKGQK